MIDQLRGELPIHIVAYDLAALEVGVVVVNQINGWCTPGAGPLAPAAGDARIGRMIEETSRLVRGFVDRRRAVLALVDARCPGRSPAGGDAEKLVPELAWLGDEPDVTILRTDCVDGFVGGIEAVHHGTHGATRNRVVDWVNAHRLQTVLVAGMCTDVAVMDFVLTMLSARNHGLMATLQDIVVLEPATATYDLSRQAAADLGLPPTAAHPKLPTHHMGLYFMASRGAILAGELTGL
ncbi:MAG: isochorismatase family protein [Geminicoccaceae bacterium]